MQPKNHPIQRKIIFQTSIFWGSMFIFPGCIIYWKLGDFPLSFVCFGCFFSTTTWRSKRSTKQAWHSWMAVPWFDVNSHMEVGNWFKIDPPLKLTASSPLKIGLLPQKGNGRLPFPSIFRWFLGGYFFTLIKLNLGKNLEQKKLETPLG